MRIHHLNCATMCPRFGRLVNPERTMVCHCLLIEAPHGLILVDTGIGTSDVMHPKQLGRSFLFMANPVLSREETASAQVEALGFQSADVRDIVVTHLDIDHAGGLPDFPNARVHIYDVELEAARARATRVERIRYHRRHWAHEVDWQAHATDGEMWFGFESVRAVGDTDEEILIVPLQGHSRGHAGVAVNGDDGWLLHCGDAYFFRDEVDPDNPRCTFGLKIFQSFTQLDKRARFANQERLRELRREHNQEVTLFCAHDPVELAQLGRD